MNDVRNQHGADPLDAMEDMAGKGATEDSFADGFWSMETGTADAAKNIATGETFENVKREWHKADGIDGSAHPIGKAIAYCNAGLGVLDDFAAIVGWGAGAHKSSEPSTVEPEGKFGEEAKPEEVKPEGKAGEPTKEAPKGDGDLFEDPAKTEEPPKEEPPKEEPPKEEPPKPSEAKETEAPKEGDTGGGPGKYVKGPKRTGKGIKYQNDKMGTDLEYAVQTDKMKSGKKLFDGYDPQTGELLDSKDWNNGYPPKGSKTTSAINDAIKQVQIAREHGTTVRWEVPTEAAKTHLEKVFDIEEMDDYINDIKIVVNPK